MRGLFVITMIFSRLFVNYNGSDKRSPSRLKYNKVQVEVSKIHTARKPWEYRTLIIIISELNYEQLTL